MLLLCMREGELRWAIPAHQVEQALSADDVAGAAPLVLGSGPPSDEGGGQRTLLVGAATDRRALRVSDVHLLEVEEEPRFLPPLVSRLIAMPHVVGVVEHAGTLLWFLDLSLHPAFAKT
jgi:hypothetical protein